MSDKKFEVGDLVWAKMKSYPFWPSKIVNPPEHIKTPNSKKPLHCVLFFGTRDYAWISNECIVPHSEEMVLSSSKGSKKVSSALQGAIDEIIELSKNMCDDSFASLNGDNNSENAEETSISTSPQISNFGEEKALEETGNKGKKVKSKKIYPKKENSTSASGDSDGSGSISDGRITTAIISAESSNESDDIFALQHFERKPEKKVGKTRKKVAVNKKPVKRPKEGLTNEDTKRLRCSPTYISDENGDYSPVLADVTPDAAYSPSDSVSDSLTDSPTDSPIDNGSPSDSDVSDEVLDSALLGPAFIERPSSPDFDVMAASKFLKSKQITPTSKKIGFLGLGNIGQGVVKNLLLSGHKVTVWNRNSDKCEPFVKAGACKGLTPADVVASCDIIFSCVSDSMAVKYLLFGNSGVLSGFEGCTVGTKGYVEMTSIDATTSQQVSLAISNFGGRYLEAPVIGSRQLADEGALLSLVAGDRALFADCFSCFFAFTKNVYFVGNDIGSGCKMNLVQNMLLGTTSAALAEAMALVESCGLSKASFLEILEMGQLSCPLIVDKSNAMSSRNFITNTPLKYQQKNLSYALKLGNSCIQSTMLTSAANQLFKRAELLNYSDHDVSAVIMGAH